MSQAQKLRGMARDTNEKLSQKVNQTTRKIDQTMREVRDKIGEIDIRGSANQLAGEVMARQNATDYKQMGDWP